MTRYAKTMSQAIAEMQELQLERMGYTPKEIKMAIGIASDPRYKQGNYSGAVKQIEKIKKGLSTHKQVAAVLKRQNENLNCGCGKTPCETYGEDSLDEKYDLYHKDFSSAMQHAYDYAQKKLGITVDKSEIDRKVATGPRKPSEGKTNKYRLKGKGGNLQIQVYNKGGSKPFELNMYKEEFESDLDENKVEVGLDENKLTYVEYKFKDKNEAMKAKKVLLKYFNEVDDEDINRGVIIVDAGRRDMNKAHEEIMKKFRPKVLSGRKIDRKGNVLDMKEEVELKEKGPCWDGFKQVGMKMKGGKRVPNCVPESWTQEDIDENLRKVKGTDNLYEPKKMTKFARTKSMMDYLKTRDKKDADKRKKDKNTSDYKMRMFNQMENAWGEITEKDAKSGKELNNPTRGDVKKYKVYVKNDKGNVVKVEFGDPNMSIKRDDPEARKNFRARHNCDQKKDKTTAGYWSCKFWSTKSVSDLMKG